MATHSQGSYTKYRSGKYEFSELRRKKAIAAGDTGKHYPANLYGKGS
jgi:hypothetical protein